MPTYLHIDEKVAELREQIRLMEAEIQQLKETVRLHEKEIERLKVALTGVPRRRADDGE